MTAALGAHVLTPSITGRDSALYAVRWFAGRGSLTVNRAVGWITHSRISLSTQQCVQPVGLSWLRYRPGACRSNAVALAELIKCQKWGASSLWMRMRCTCWPQLSIDP